MREIIPNLNVLMSILTYILASSVKRRVTEEIIPFFTPELEFTTFFCAHCTTINALEETVKFWVEEDLGDHALIVVGGFDAIYMEDCATAFDEGRFNNTWPSCSDTITTSTPPRFGEAL
jgi:hypothetical protein